MTSIGKSQTVSSDPGPVDIDNEPAETDRLRRLVRELVRGERRFHALPQDLTADEAARVRRRALEEIGGTPLEHTGHYTLDGE